MYVYGTVSMANGQRRFTPLSGIMYEREDAVNKVAGKYAADTGKDTFVFKLTGKFEVPKREPKFVPWVEEPQPVAVEMIDLDDDDGL